MSRPRAGAGPIPSFSRPDQLDRLPSPSPLASGTPLASLALAYMSSPSSSSRDASPEPQPQPPPNPPAPAPEPADGLAGQDGPPQPADVADDDTLDTSFFPAAAHYYARYSDANLAAAAGAELMDKAGEAYGRAELEPPVVEWVVERGAYSVFGQEWPVEEEVPRLGDSGVREMFDRGRDRSASLLDLLRALILSYSSLVGSLLTPPPSLADPAARLPDGSEAPTEAARLADHIRLVAVNMHFLINELRPIQARETLKGMMRSQIEQRKAKTAAIREKCAELSQTLARSKGQLERTLAGLSAPTPAGEETEQAGGAVARRKLGRERLRALLDGIEGGMS